MSDERWFLVHELIGLPGMPDTREKINDLAARKGWEKKRVQSGRVRSNAFPLSDLPAVTQKALQGTSQDTNPQHTDTDGNTDGKQTAAWDERDAPAFAVVNLLKKSISETLPPGITPTTSIMLVVAALSEIFGYQQTVASLPGAEIVTFDLPPLTETEKSKMRALYANSHPHPDGQAVG
jgi:hypothetical protein